MIKTCIFPVAGLGSRFLPATKSIPKEMLVVVDRPLIQYAVEEAIASGIEKFIFVTSQGKGAIEDHFDRLHVLEKTLQERNQLDLLAKITENVLGPNQAVYIRQPAPLGLGHAIMCARHLIHEEAFAVMLADDLILSQIPCLQQMIAAYDPQDGNMVATLEVPEDHVSRYGILDSHAINHGTKGSKITATSVVEKPPVDQAPSRMAIMGRYVLKNTVFDQLTKQMQGPSTAHEIQLTDCLHTLITQNTPLTGFLFEGTRFDCGTKEGLIEANIAFALTQPDIAHHMRAILEKYTGR